MIAIPPVPVNRLLSRVAGECHTPSPVDPGLSLNPVLFLAPPAAGMVSFAPPCVLPLVPAYLGFITGRSAEELQGARGRARLTIVTQGLAFVLGLAVIFALLGASASVLGQALLQNLQL